MSPLFDQIADQLNLRWAWDKVRNQAYPGDVWFDEVALASFELDLEENLRRIAADIQKGTFHTKPLKPLPYPKQKGSSTVASVREMFYVEVSDQVAWTAVINIVGPYVDSKMPPWSYGNRLFRSIWIEESAVGKSGNTTRKRMIGRYRHSSGRIYLSFGQSWPIFRRHVYLATLAMAHFDKKTVQLDDRTQEEQTLQEQLEAEYRCPFVVSEYWREKRPKSDVKDLYWCSLDLKRFYPSVHVDIVRKNIVHFLPDDWKSDADRLLQSMLEFSLDTSGWAPDELKLMVGRNRKTLKHIPTGLYVAGFLANAGLIGVDLEVERRLNDRRVAHLRYVDDHIVLGYSFEDLVSWILEYTAILKDFDTGAKINSDKVEPKELADLLKRRRKTTAIDPHSSVWTSAETACRLDPRFPSPLMTKTLALVSAIARTDFNLLELSELTAITDQLEHLLLVDIPEQEIPHKTRIAFAATRLIRLIEAREACSTPTAEAHRPPEGIQTELPFVDQSVPPPSSESLNEVRGEIRRVFQLLRKVIRERPDSIRLWTRALQMCRSIGAAGAAYLVEDLQHVRDNGDCQAISTEYLSAMLLIQSAAHAISAARIIRSDSAARWRRLAAYAYLKNDLESLALLRPREGAHWFLERSWLHFCVGVYCAELTLRDNSTPGLLPCTLSLSGEECDLGEACLNGTHQTTHPASWAWWAVRFSVLMSSEAHATGLVKEIGNRLPPSKESIAFWRFFPADAPQSALENLLRDHRRSQQLQVTAGWWFDALRDRPQLISSLGAEAKAIPVQVKHLIERKYARALSLYEWCACLAAVGDDDPRTGEWTALEITRQITSLVTQVPTFGLQYIKASRNSQLSFPHLHPANFLIPDEWRGRNTGSRFLLSWDQWHSLVKQHQVRYVPSKDRIQDRRYTPIERHSLLFSMNPIRGLGILLYGLLQRSFELPALWNGSGQSEVLNRLPRMLLSNLTCSSWSLGILAGCLWPRTTENIFQTQYPQEGYRFEDDTARDPVQFIDTGSLERAIEVAQARLREQQLSTMGGRSRQLTPINVLQLTDPVWSKDFQTPHDGDNLPDERD